MKTRRQSATKVQRREAGAGDREASAAYLQEQLDQQTVGRSAEDLLRRLAQQTATSEVLRIISSFSRILGARVSGHVGERNADLRG